MDNTPDPRLDPVPPGSIPWDGADGWAPAPAPPAGPGEDPRPIRLVVLDPDLRRNRLTVLVRAILAIPLFIWAGLWTVMAAIIAIVSWFVVLAKGRLPDPLHDFFSSYVRFLAHLDAYFSFAANAYPSFTGKPGYAIDVEIDPPRPQARWKAALRIVLALPALVLSSSLAGSVPLPSATFSGGSGSDTTYGLGFQGGGALLLIGFLGWFVCLARGRMSPGLRDLAAYAIGYGSQVLGYVTFLTDRYPSADPACVLPPLRIPRHPVRVVGTDDLRRSRLLVLLRLPLCFPHLVWLALWSAIVVVISPIVWLLVLVLGRLPRPLQRFLSSWVRAYGQFTAFATLVAGPFPGFVGAPGYPVDLELDVAAPQHRLRTLFRLLLAVPALLLSGVFSGALLAIAILLWFAGLATGRAPAGIQALGTASVRYLAQVQAYTYLVTDRYPFSSPALVEEAAPVPAPAPAEPLPFAAPA